METAGLTKRFGPRTAVDRLDLVVRRGEVYGFLGPNGAGKTTALRVVLGLVRSSAGTVRVLGSAPGTPAVLRRIGMLVESPAFYPYMSARGNLRVLARLSGTAASGIDEVLETVDLADRADDRVQGYSLGMEQRLGVAGALLLTGSEYGWNTMKLLLTAGPSRHAIVLGKVAALAAMLAGLVAAAFAFDAGAALLVATVEDRPADWPGAADLLLGAAAGWLVVLMWGLAGAFLGVLSRGTAVAIGVGLVWSLAGTSGDP